MVRTSFKVSFTSSAEWSRCLGVSLFCQRPVPPFGKFKAPGILRLVIYCIMKMKVGSYTTTELLSLGMNYFELGSLRHLIKRLLSAYI